MASRRLTMTPRAAIWRAPCASVMVTMAGSSSGDMPTASAIANSSESTGGRERKILAANTASAITSMMRIKR